MKQRQRSPSPTDHSPHSCNSARSFIKRREGNSLWLDSHSTIIINKSRKPSPHVCKGSDVIKAKVPKSRLYHHFFFFDLLQFCCRPLMGSSSALPCLSPLSPVPTSDSPWSHMFLFLNCDLPPNYTLPLIHCKQSEESKRNFY